MADELISRQAAKEAVKYIPWCDWKAVGDCLDKLPAADAVPVVRCKDCKYYKRNGSGYGECPFFDEVKDDEYCSSGERRESGG